MGWEEENRVESFHRCRRLLLGAEMPSGEGGGGGGGGEGEGGGGYLEVPRNS